MPLMNTPWNKAADELGGISPSQLPICLLGILHLLLHTWPRLSGYANTWKDGHTKIGALPLPQCCTPLQSERGLPLFVRVTADSGKELRRRMLLTEVGIKGKWWGHLASVHHTPRVSTFPSPWHCWELGGESNFLFKRRNHCRKFQSLIIILAARFYCMFLKEWN